MSAYFSEFLAFGIGAGFICGFIAFFWGYALKKILSYFR